MRSVFEELPNEWRGQSFRTTRTPPHRRADLERVVGIVATHHVARDWVLRVNEGSLTLQNSDVKHAHEVVTVFVDVGNALARKEGLSLHPEPIVVAVELSGLPALQRKCVRDYLRATFGGTYCDPAAGHAKRHLQPPDKKHFFDILFLAEGPCDLPVAQATLGRIAELVARGEGAEATVAGLVAEDEITR